MGPGVSANPNLSAVQEEEDMSEANESLIQKDFVDAPVRRYRLDTIQDFFCASVQLNKYETASNFIQLCQNLTSDCLLISVFLLVFTSFCMM